MLCARFYRQQPFEILKRRTGLSQRINRYQTLLFALLEHNQIFRNHNFIPLLLTSEINFANLCGLWTTFSESFTVMVLSMSEKGEGPSMGCKGKKTML